MTSDQERLYYLGFSVFPGIGPMKFTQLLTAFDAAKKAWQASERDLEEVVGPAIANKLVSFRSTFNINDYAQRLREKQVSFVTLSDEDYPQNLKQIKNPPFVFYYIGTLSLNILKHLKTISIVGTRKITSYGKEVTEMITQELVAASCVIVSGLATGVDATSHQATIDNGGDTIAVLGCGVDCCFPATNQQLYNSILEHEGLIISEYPLSQQPTKGSFPSRNRIIAGLSDAIVVTEGAEDSGALITAEFALEFGRKLFAVPGPITSQLSKGPNTLIGKGAKLVTSGKDILENLGITSTTSTTRIIKGETAEEQKIIDLLQNEPLHFDELVKRTNMQSSELGTLLSLMEVKGFVKSLDDGFFAIE